MTVLCPQPLAADLVFEAGSVVGSADTLVGKMTEPANPAPRVAMAPIKERRSFNADPDSRFGRFFDVIPTPTCRSYPSRFSITEIVYLSIKITGGQAGINPRIHAIAGGFHLVVISDAEIEKIVATLHGTYKVEYVAPGHCTGEPAFTALKKAFGDRYLYAGLGTTVELVPASQK
jgi:hypothetical protein